MMTSSSSSTGKGKRVQNAVENAQIGHLPNDVLKRILRRLSEKDAVNMSVSSKRWMDLWNRRPHLMLDITYVMIMNKNPFTNHKVFADFVTKAIKKHIGHLESCTIRHSLSQLEVGTLARWIQAVTLVKQTKELNLENEFNCMMNPGSTESDTLLLPPSTFSHPSLTSLSLRRYILKDTHAFNNCSNLKILNLFNIISEASVFTRVFAACSSLEVLVVHLLFLNPRGMLKIEHNNLQYLQLWTCSDPIDRIEVYAPRLDVLDLIFVSLEKDNFILAAPNIPFKINCSINGSLAHVSYNTSSLAQEKKIIWHDLMVSQSFIKTRWGSLSVRIDLTNPKEVDILKEVLLMWNGEMTELEILFKNDNAPREDQGECSVNGGAQNNILLDDAKPFPDANFRVNTVRLYNFNGSNQEEFTVALLLVMQETVTSKLLIETSSLPPKKKLMTEAAMANLKKVPKGNKNLIIERF